MSLILIVISSRLSSGVAFSIGKPIPWTDNSLGSILAKEVSIPFILLYHFPSFSKNSEIKPFFKFLLKNSTYHPSWVSKL